MSETIIRRDIHPEIKVLDESKGLVRYIASDESVDSYGEVIRAKGWKFSRFKKNAPFVDSHDYDCIKALLGKVTAFEVNEKGQLVEDVQWAIDVPENTLALLGWKMLLGGYLKAVSVGFLGVKRLTPWGDPAAFAKELSDLGMNDKDGVNTIWQQQEQIELSAVIVGANSNALAKAWRGGCVKDADMDLLSRQLTGQSLDDTLSGRSAETAKEAESRGHASDAAGRAALLREITRAVFTT
jgi:hypothetical protein